ncbi:uridine kinase [uncultured Oscillibacter sp.]|uniref:uridine kinase family protein n=1 Tax=uncultured Oscillibacter sp. TaxID=876091 RepID=UPI00261F104A|nr:hypothetical protein [uncultured Oscillibacter sp.]
MRVDFLDAARAHWARYPLMEPRDFAKLAYQSEFGPAHMAEGPDRVLAALLAERKEAGPDPLPPEPIGNGLCRLHITQALSTLSELPLIGRMFTRTMASAEGTASGLSEKLDRLAALPVPGLPDYLESWRREGCPPVRHSEAFRKAYRPHYRVVRQDLAGYLPALVPIDRLSREHYAAWLRLSHSGALEGGASPRERGLRPYLVAVDGRCGSGKTGFSGIVEQLIPCRMHVAHMDHFYLPPERRGERWTEVPAGNMDLERLRREILLPVRSGKPLTYPPFLPDGPVLDEYGEEIEMDPDDAALILVEGTYSQHPSLSEFYDYKMFLTCEREEQTRRLRAREGSYYPTFDRVWRTLEERYFSACGTQAAADLTVDTTDFFG